MAEKVVKEERPTKPFSQNLTEAGLGKRFFAILIDIALFMLPSYLIGSYGTIPAYTQREGGSYSLMQTAYSLMEETHLFAVTKSGTAYSSTNYYYLSDTGNSVTPGSASYVSGDSSLASDPERDAYVYYEDMVYNYYTIFLPKVLNEYKDTSYITPYVDSDGNAYTTKEQYRTFYYETVLGLPTAEAYNAAEESARDTLTDSYYTYDTMEDESGNIVADTSSPAVLKETYRKAAVDERNATTLATLNTYFFDTSSSTVGGVYGEACNNFTGAGSKGVSQSFYANSAAWYSSESLMAFMFIYFPLLFVFMLIIPMCDKYGRTVGKWIFGLQVCRLLDNGEGVKMKWWHNLMRCMYMTAILSLFGIFTLAPMIIGFLFMISYFVLMLGKRHQSIHDVLLHTVVVNKKGSTIYDSEEAIYDAKMEELAQEKANLYRPPEVLDLSTINSARDLANKYDSFDDIENEDVEVKTYTEYKKEEPAPETSDDYFDEEIDDDPLGLGDVGPQKKIDPTEVKLTKEDDE